MDLKIFIVKIMENEINTTLPEKRKALPEVISPAIEMPDITPLVKQWK